MAVYERTFRTYSGPLTPQRSRFLILPRYAYREVFRSRLFAAFLVLACVLWPLVLALLIYLPHNLSFLATMQTGADTFVSTFGYRAGFFFHWFMVPQRVLSFLLAFVLGPALISADLRNNGLPLYLARPFGRAEYVVGKATVLIALLSCMTWIPGLLLFLLQSYLGGGAWFRENYRIGIAIFLCSWIWILVLSLLSLAISSHVKWKPAARVMLLGVFFILAAAGGLLDLMLRTSWGSVIDIFDMVGVVWSGLFGVSKPIDVPIWAAWLSLLTACAICLLLLARKVRAYEVVR